MMGRVQTDVVTWAREAFDLGAEDVSITPGARGAQGQVWRLEVGRRVFALTQVFLALPAGNCGWAVRRQMVSNSWRGGSRNYDSPTRLSSSSASSSQRDASGSGLATRAALPKRSAPDDR